MSKLGLLALVAAASMVDYGNPIFDAPPGTYRRPSGDPIYKRKKCKSCESFPCKIGLSPLSRACQLYKHK